MRTRGKLEVRDWLPAFLNATSREAARTVLLRATLTKFAVAADAAAASVANTALARGEHVLTWAWSLMALPSASVIAQTLVIEGIDIIDSSGFEPMEREALGERVFQLMDDVDRVPDPWLSPADDKPALPLPLLILDAHDWMRAANYTKLALGLHRDAIDATDRDQARGDIEDQIHELADLKTRAAGEAALALRMLVCDPRRPSSFHSLLPALEILLGDAGSPPDLGCRLDVWWRCARGEFALSTLDAFRLSETERKLGRWQAGERDDLDPTLEDDETTAPKPNPWKRRGPPPNTVVVLKKLHDVEKRGLNTIWATLAGKAIPLHVAKDVASVRRTLVNEYPHAVAVVDGLMRDLREASPVRVRPIILVGPPGGGKSRIVRRLAELLGGLYVYRFDASAAHDAMFSGSPKTWSSSQPSVPARAIVQSQIANPIVMLDEIEKAGSGTYNGRLWDSLVPFLERETSARYPESGLGDAQLDLSHINYVATANSVDALPGPLRDRFRILRVPSPTLQHLPALARHVMSDLARGDEARSHDMPLAADELAVIGRAWARERFSMRKLQRLVAATLEARDAFAPRH